MLYSINVCIENKTCSPHRFSRAAVQCMSFHLWQDPVDKNKTAFITNKEVSTDYRLYISVSHRHSGRGYEKLKVLCLGLTKYFSPNSKYWRGVISPSSSSSDFTHTQVARLTIPTGTSAHEDEWNEIRGAKIQLGKLALDGFPKPKHINIPGLNAHFQRRITDCSIVFQINKYVNLACFLNICKHMIFFGFSRVKNLYTAPLKLRLVSIH